MKTCILEHLEKLVAAATIEETWALHCIAMNNFGFDKLIYGFTRFRSERGLGAPGDLMVLSNHDPCFLETFIHGGLFRNAPMVKWAVENVGDCSWSLIREREHELTDEEKRIVALSLENGMAAGYTISFPEVSRRNKGAIGLAAYPGVAQHQVDELWRRDGQTIKLINDIFHLKATSLPYSLVNPLTGRQQEVLEWVGEGKTTQDIAAILGVSIGTVEKHLRLARDVLEVETTAQAVLKASYKDQIFLAPRPPKRFQ